MTEDDGHDHVVVATAMLVLGVCVQGDMGHGDDDRVGRW